MSPFDLSGKVALITGSSRGIGRSIAEGYAQAGARVVISSRSQADCDVVAAALNTDHGPGRAIAVAADIADKAGLGRLVAETHTAFGQIDVLICNAATNPYYGPMAGISDEQFTKTLQNNVISSHWLISMVAPEMLERGQGAIILVSSIGGYIGSPVLGAYSISKAADLQMARNLALEFGPRGVRVNAIAPGVIRTEFARALWEAPELERSLQRSTALGRLGEADDIGGTAVYLGSDAARFVTGQSIIVDGGLTIRGIF